MSQGTRTIKITGAHIVGIFLLLLIVGAVVYFMMSRFSAGPFVGSINSDVYHYPSCTYAKRIKASNKISFANATDARAHGYRPCKVCKPP